MFLALMQLAWQHIKFIAGEDCWGATRTLTLDDTGSIVCNFKVN